jgi:hypothetical protein
VIVMTGARLNASTGARPATTGARPALDRQRNTAITTNPEN